MCKDEECYNAVNETFADLKAKLEQVEAERDRLLECSKRGWKIKTKSALDTKEDAMTQ